MTKLHNIAVDSRHIICADNFLMKAYTRAQSFLWVFDRSLICLLLGYIFDTWQLWGELDEITIFYEDLSRKTIKKQIYWKGHLTAVMTMLMKYFYQEQVR